MIDLILSLLIVCAILAVMLFMFGQVHALVPLSQFVWVAWVVCAAMVFIFLLQILIGYGDAGIASYLR